MFWTLVTVIIAGFAGAGIGLALRHLSRKRLPHGVIPISIGLCMLAAAVGQEYGWYDGARSTMPEDLVVISTREQQAWYQPWTFVQPWVRGFISYAPSEARETAQGSGLLVVQLRLQERWNPQMIRPALIDCGNRRWTDLTASMEFTETGHPVEATWREDQGDDPILNTICGGETAER